MTRSSTCFRCAVAKLFLLKVLFQTVSRYIVLFFQELTQPIRACCLHWCTLSFPFTPPTTLVVSLLFFFVCCQMILGRSLVLWPPPLPPPHQLSPSSPPPAALSVVAWETSTPNSNLSTTRSGNSGSKTSLLLNYLNQILPSLEEEELLEVAQDPRTLSCRPRVGWCRRESQGALRRNPILSWLLGGSPRGSRGPVVVGVVDGQEDFHSSRDKSREVLWEGEDTRNSNLSSSSSNSS